ncbi:hypothetical protein BAE30_14125 [Acidithiobacillus caldus]|uniref:Uncharacterized protein n=1 Tax=Acidithiobacillus caldus TaxID=33059 RepID=A0A1E7YSY9_9PROT|nr:hypothetical protein BAE30_14125 [Acidithiobacillus caldus]
MLIRKATIIFLLGALASPCFAETAGHHSIPSKDQKAVHYFEPAMKYKPGLYFITGKENIISRQVVINHDVRRTECIGSRPPYYFNRNKNIMNYQMQGRSCRVKILRNTKDVYYRDLFCTNVRKGSEADESIYSRLDGRNKFYIGLAFKEYRGNNLYRTIKFSGIATYRKKDCWHKMKSVPYDSLYGDK